MSTIQLYVQETPVLTFQKASLPLLGELLTVEVNKTFRLNEREELFQELEQACVQLLQQGRELLESIGETEDFIDFAYVTYENRLSSPTLEQLLQFPFHQVQAILSAVFREVADEVAEKFFEELSNRLEEAVDDELMMAVHVEEDALQIELLAPHASIETISFAQLLQDYQGTLEEATRWFLEDLL